MLHRSMSHSKTAWYPAGAMSERAVTQRRPAVPSDGSGAPRPAPAARPGAGARLVGVFLIALMAVGSALMWVGMPVGWLWLASHLQKGANPTLGPYLLVAFGVPISMAIIGKLLGGLDRRYARVMKADAHNVRAQLPWMKSLRGERGSGHQRTVLDVVMIVSVAIAWAAFAIWFFGFAGSSLPS
jgi:hypothetical protein